MDAADEDGAIAAMAQVPALYIADGHHRAASAARVRDRLRSHGAGEWDRFLAVAFADDQMQVLPYNRVVRDLGTWTSETLLAALGERFQVAAGPPVPERRGEVGMFMDGQWRTIALAPAAAAAAAADRLDVSRLQDTILAPLLGIADPRTDKRIDFIGGSRGTAELEARVTSGRAAVAFSMFPVGVNELMEIADDGGIMPPKSTWFEPKLRDGLLVHLL
jgi:uncharacterized protein (DUF1015 family)